jgi:hypothetical protein
MFRCYLINEIQLANVVPLMTLWRLLYCTLTCLTQYDSLDYSLANTPRLGENHKDTQCAEINR